MKGATGTQGHLGAYTSLGGTTTSFSYPISGGYSDATTTYDPLTAITSGTILVSYDRINTNYALSSSTTVTRYDELGRPGYKASDADDPNWLTPDPATTHFGTDLITRHACGSITTGYSIDPINGNYTKYTEYTWYDANGVPIGSWSTSTTGTSYFL